MPRPTTSSVVSVQKVPASELKVGDEITIFDQRGVIKVVTHDLLGKVVVTIELRGKKGLSILMILPMGLRITVLKRSK